MNTAAVIEYHVETACGRNFCWSAYDMEHLFRDLHAKCYTATRVMLQSEYEAEQDEIRRIQKQVEGAGCGMSHDARSYIKERGWKWEFTDSIGKPEPRPTHWKYGASQLMIPTLTADLYGVVKEVRA